jgi:hypothetical protein
MKNYEQFKCSDNNFSSLNAEIAVALIFIAKMLLCQHENDQNKIIFYSSIFHQTTLYKRYQAYFYLMIINYI